VRFTISGKSLKDHFEAVGHAEAYDFLYILVNDKTVREKDIRPLSQLHLPPKIVLFPLIFIASPHRPFQVASSMRYESKNCL
jgi:hypothetical protein